MTTIELPDSISVRSQNLDARVTDVSTEKFSAEFVVDAIVYMWDVRIQRAQAKVDKDDPQKDAKKAKERDDMFTRLCAGEIIKATGKRGARQTPEQKGWAAFLNQLGRKENGNKISGVNLTRAQESVCREWLLKTKGNEIDKAHMATETKSHFGEFTAYMENNNPGLIAQIEYFKKESAAVSLGF